MLFVLVLATRFTGFIKVGLNYYVKKKWNLLPLNNKKYLNKSYKTNFNYEYKYNKLNFCLHKNEILLNNWYVRCCVSGTVEVPHAPAGLGHEVCITKNKITKLPKQIEQKRNPDNKKLKKL